ncbi:MAG: hypothetical protein QF890_07240 [Myxococcota bacterium]|jgi:hypothetical protein|nr:hypothetical protein [Deltaproteobacteria bacterium]MDP6075604.1 hypothetical protein [Myxococcota bacterium]MDP6242726.1 hypothetical protein [Myxococcota bacterium]MDP7074501.1 hypothetical protein [Myxococcota bacterium]MDP7298415.1 hypothetical protein [Myxococcota bacterium]
MFEAALHARGNTGIEPGGGVSHCTARRVWAFDYTSRIPIVERCFLEPLFIRGRPDPDAPGYER